MSDDEINKIIGEMRQQMQEQADRLHQAEGKIFQLRVELDQSQRRLKEVWPPKPSSDSSGSSAGAPRIGLLSEDGTGFEGDSATGCSFHYDITDFLTGEEVGEGIGLTGKGRRDAVGKMFAATIGEYVVDPETGTVYLVDADEYNPRRVCDA